MDFKIINQKLKEGCNVCHEPILNSDIYYYGDYFDNREIELICHLCKSKLDKKRAELIAG